MAALPPRVQNFETDIPPIQKGHQRYIGTTAIVPRRETPAQLRQIYEQLDNGNIDVTHINNVEAKRYLLRAVVNHHENLQGYRNGVRLNQVALQMDGPRAVLAHGVNAVRRPVDTYRSTSALMRACEHDHEIFGINQVCGPAGLQRVQEFFDATRVYAVDFNTPQQVQNFGNVQTAAGRLRDEFCAFLGPPQAHQQQLTLMQAQLAAETNAVAARDTTIQNLQMQVATLTLNLTNSNADVTARDAQITTLQANLVTRKTTITQQRSQITALQNDATHRVGQITDLQKDLADRNKQITALQSRINDLKNNQVGDLKREILNLKGTVADRDKEILNLRETATTNDAEIKQQTTEIEKLKKDVRDSETTIQQLQDVVNERKQHVTRVENRIHELESAATSAQRRTSQRSHKKPKASHFLSPENEGK